MIIYISPKLYILDSIYLLTYLQNIVQITISGLKNKCIVTYLDNNLL